MPPIWWCSKRITFNDLLTYDDSDMTVTRLIHTIMGLLVYADQCDNYQYHIFSNLPDHSLRTRSIALIMIAYNTVNNLNFVNINEESYDSNINIAGLNVNAILEAIEQSYDLSNIPMTIKSIPDNLNLIAKYQFLGGSMTTPHVLTFLRLCDRLKVLTQIYKGEIYAHEDNIHLFPPHSFSPDNPELFMSVPTRYADERGEFMRDYKDMVLKHVVDKDRYLKMYTEFMTKRSKAAIEYWCKQEPALLLSTVIKDYDFTIPELEEELKTRIKRNRDMLILDAGEPVNQETTLGDKWYMHSNIYLVSSGDAVYALTSQEISHAETNVYTNEKLYFHRLEYTIALQTEWENILHLDIDCDPLI